MEIQRCDLVNSSVERRFEKSQGHIISAIVKKDSTNVYYVNDVLKAQQADAIIQGSCRLLVDKSIVDAALISVLLEAKRLHFHSTGA